MSTIVEFGNWAVDWDGVERVNIDWQRNGQTISLTASDGATIVGTARDWRTLAFVLIGMTDPPAKLPEVNATGQVWSKNDDQWVDPPPLPQPGKR